MAEGFPFKDSLTPILGALVSELYPDARNRIFPPEVVVMASVAAVLARDLTLRSAVVRNNADRATRGQPPSSLNTAAFSDARMRLDEGLFRRATIEFANQTSKQVQASTFWGEMTPYVIDGTTLTANDSEDNQAAFPQHASQANGVGFPILRVVVVQALSTGMVCDMASAAFKGKGTGEMALAREVVPTLEGDVLLLGDRYFPSYFFMADLLKRGWNGIFPTHAAREADFRKGEWLGYRDHIVSWDRPVRSDWMTREEYETYPRSLRLRETEVREKKSGNDRIVLVTTLLDETEFSTSRLAGMYKKRWKVELALRDLKATFEMGHIAANTPEMVRKLIWSHLLAYNVLRWHMLNASSLFDTDLEHVSVTAAATVISANAVLIGTTKKRALPALFSSLYSQIVQVPVGIRPGRIEPRAVKKRPKPRRYLMEKRSAWHASQLA